VPGPAHPVSVALPSHGVASIGAAGDLDAFLALGYLHARFRLTEMDLERRLGEGRIAQLAGPDGLSSDKFELRLGLLRTAQAEWAATGRTSTVGRALLAYSRGINDYLAQARRSGDWPSIYALAGVYPAPSTPVDSLVIQGVLTQQLDYTTTPLDRALLERSLGRAHTMAWFPILPRGPQHPYDPGPYKHRGIAPIAPQAGQAQPPLAAQSHRPGPSAAAGVALPAGLSAPRPSGATTVTAADVRQPAGPSAPATQRAEATVSGPGTSRVTAQVARAASAILAQANALPPGLIHQYPDSNAWAANGPAVAGAKSMLAGDPHLPQKVPSIWYQAALSAPGLSVTGVTVPGLPGVLLGHNAHIAWSLTDTQNQATLFYAEQTSKSRPGQYFWRGAWRRMRHVPYTIPVRGAPPAHLTVDITVHGPVMTQAGETTSVDWM